jgi:hypothetical protein
MTKKSKKEWVPTAEEIRKVDQAVIEILLETVGRVEKQLEEDSSRENVFNGLFSVLEEMADHAAARRYDAVLVGVFITKAMLYTLHTNPMFDSPALALQFRSAARVLIDNQQRSKHKREK